jgi:predicted MPP superfamily phosphohydrolase
VETNGAAAGTYNLILNIGSTTSCTYTFSFTPSVGTTKNLGSASPNSPKNMNVTSYYKLTGLKLGTAYSYSCSASGFTSGIFTLQFPHSQTSTKLLAFGDWSDQPAGNKGINAQSYGPVTLNYLQTRKGDDLILFAGDLAYNLHNINRPSTVDNGATGDSWLNKIMPVTTQTPLQFIWGNHEAIEGAPFNNYFQRFAFPDQATGKGNWYSFDVNNVHVLTFNNNILAGQFSSNYFINLQSALTTWINNDLAKNTKPWTILYLHNPLYCSYTPTSDNRCDSTAVTVRNFLEPLIKGKVDLVVVAHLHSYERGYPALNGAPVMAGVNGNTYTNPQAPVNVLCGNPGQSEGISSTYTPNSYSAKVLVTPGVCEIVVKDDTLTLSMYGGTIGSTNSAFTVQDSFSIVKSGKGKGSRKLRKSKN